MLVAPTLTRRVALTASETLVVRALISIGICPREVATIQKKTGVPALFFNWMCSQKKLRNDSLIGFKINIWIDFEFMMFITILLQQVIVEIQNKFSEMSYPNLFLYVSVIEHMCVAIDHFEVS